MKAVANAMSSQEPTILSALDGVEGVSTHRTASDSEPKALFYVLIGLVYETLLSTSADATSSSSARESATVALQAMRSLVQPRYCGRAILEPSVFGEFTSLCYRMAITETASVQIHLISVIVSFAQSQRNNISSMEVSVNCVLKVIDTHKCYSANGSNEGLQSDSPLIHCLRICCYILRENIPRSNVSFTRTSYAF
jgi:HEAT repeat-containing protein 5